MPEGDEPQPPPGGEVSTAAFKTLLEQVPSPVGNIFIDLVNQPPQNPTKNEPRYPPPTPPVCCSVYGNCSLVLLVTGGTIGT